MNKKITFPQLAAAIAGLTSSSEATSEIFIKELLDLITDTLSKGESITIKGLGSFAPGMSDENPVIWSPDHELAEAVNSPFAFFEPVVLATGVNENILNTESIDNVSHEPHRSPDIPPIPKSAETIPPEIPQIPANETIVEENMDDSATSTTTQQPEATTLPSTVDDIAATGSETTGPDVTDIEDISPYYDDCHPKCRRFNPWLALIIGFLAGIVTGYLASCYINGDASSVNHVTPDDTIIGTDTVITDLAPSENDTIAKVTHQPIDTLTSEYYPIAIDTVTTSRYLTTMSRKYYGDYRFWVYIYLENDSVIKNPNRIRPGTPIVIPAPQKYGIDVHDKESIKRAEAKIAELIANER